MESKSIFFFENKQPLLIDAAFICRYSKNVSTKRKYITHPFTLGFYTNGPAGKYALQLCYIFVAFFTIFFSEKHISPWETVYLGIVALFNIWYIYTILRWFILRKYQGFGSKACKMIVSVNDQMIVFSKWPSLELFI